MPRPCVLEKVGSAETPLIGGAGRDAVKRRKQERSPRKGSPGHQAGLPAPHRVGNADQEATIPTRGVRAGRKGTHTFPWLHGARRFFWEEFVMNN